MKSQAISQPWLMIFMHPGWVRDECALDLALNS